MIPKKAQEIALILKFEEFFFVYLMTTNHEMLLKL